MTFGSPPFLCPIGMSFFAGPFVGFWKIIPIFAAASAPVALRFAGVAQW